MCVCGGGVPSHLKGCLKAYHLEIRPRESEEQCALAGGDFPTQENLHHPSYEMLVCSQCNPNSGIPKDFTSSITDI